MNDVTVVTSVTYPSPESLALVADVQYHEPYLSAALNRKFRGIVDPGFYAGFFPKPGGGMNLLITSVDGDKTAGAASVNIGEFYQVTIQQRKDISLALSAGKKYAIVLKGRYLLGEDSYQVNTASHIHAAEFVARTYTDSYQLGDGELLVCTVNIPAGVSAITKEMIDVSDRIDLAIGIEISDSVTSTRSDVAASSLAVKKAYDLAKSKYTAQDASTTQKGLVQLSSATNSDSETMAATPKAVKSVKELADTKAPIESPSLTGTPTAPTAAQGTNSTQIANTAFVKAAITALINGAPGTLDTLKEIAAAINNDPNFSTTINNALALKAPLASPALTGIPTAPTAAQGTNNTQIATTAYVRAAISALVGSSPEALDTLNELAAALGNDPNFATTMTNALAGKQPLDATLTALAGLATGANKLPYFTGTDTVSQTDLTSVGRDILAKTSTLAVIQYLGLREIGTSGEKIPLLSTANTWSSQQTFKGKTAFSAAATFSAGIAGAIEPEAIDGRTIDLNDLIIANTEAGSVKYYQCKTVAGGANITNKPDGVSGNFLVRVESIRKTTGSDYANMQTLINSDTKRIYVRFVVNGNWTAWSQVVVSGWGQDVSVKSLSAVALSGSLTGNASTATKLQTARTIGGVSFDGSANIDLPGVNKAGNQSTTGNAATATKLQTARTIGGVSFDGSANIDLPGVNKAGNQSTTGNAATATKLQTARTIGGVSFDGSANIDLPGVNKAGNQSTTGNAATATKLQTARTIGGVSFDGSANIDLPGVNKAGNQSTTGNAATATKLQTARTINGVKFDGSANITLTAANLGLSDSSGYVGRLVNTRVFTSSGTYTPTPGTKRIRVTITGGGGGGGGCKAISNNETFFGAGGGAGGTIISIMTPTQNSYPVTIGAGGAGGVSATNGTRGGNSVFASLIAPGGAGGGKVGVTNTNGGNGGVPSTGDIRITGGDGGDGQSGNISVSGEGGTSHWGGGGRAGAGGGVIGKAYGSGGGGAYDAGYSGTSMTGGKGASGICIIEEFA
ncbi:tail fiber protein [Escherichia coli]|uniref:tail fiber protein n=1 Tax=Escherichia coli TaxID=562 RepID=UPI00237C63AF|nr:tail fiber protein [Escherichia coli]MDF0687339.1 tail fiber protein [Escherichia coli]